MEQLTITPASLADIPAIRNIAMITWPSTYGALLPDSQIEYMLATMYAPNVLNRQLQQENHTFIMASQNGKWVAFAGFGPQDDGKAYKLHKLYVLPGNQKTGAGKILLQAFEAYARAKGASLLFLNVNRANNARYFYEKMGYHIAETVDLDIGNGFWMNDYIMQKPI